MARNLDLNLVRTFIAVVDRGGMTAAARARHLTQSAVSSQIKRLEEAFGARLFARARGRGLRLTPAGQRFLPKAREFVGLNDEIWGETTNGSSNAAVRLGAPADLVATRLAPALKSYAVAWPDVELSLICAPSPDLVAMLARREIDLAIVEEPLAAAGGERLYCEPLVWTGAPNGAAHRKQPLPVSMVSAACAFRPAVAEVLRDRNRAWRPVFEAGDIEATAATVRADLAVAAWLASTIPGGLTILGAEAELPALPDFAINLHAPARGATAQAKALARHLRASFSSFGQAA